MFRQRMMIETPRVSTIDTSDRYGGLIICGLNYGLPRDGTPQGEADFKPWAKYFTHPSNRNGDRFVSRLATWFDWWGIPLEDSGMPTELNRAITQTNLFYDSSTAFASRLPEEIALAFKRLSDSIDRLNNSGILLASVTMADAARNHFCIREWETSTVGRFSLREASAGSLRVAVCPHPRCPQSQANVAALGDKMRQWIGSVMGDYRKKRVARVGRNSAAYSAE